MNWAAVAASTDWTNVGAAGALGDTISHVTIVPATTSPGAVQLRDSSSGSTITVFEGGASSVAGLIAWPVHLDMTSKAGPWQIKTGANLSAIVVGNFR